MNIALILSMMIMVVDPIYKPSVCVDRMIGAKRGKLGMEEAEKSCRPARAHARKSATSTTTKQAKNKHQQITKNTNSNCILARAHARKSAISTTLTTTTTRKTRKTRTTILINVNRRSCRTERSGEIESGDGTLWVSQQCRRC